jgi:hypothetical protein
MILAVLSILVFASRAAAHNNRTVLGTISVGLAIAGAAAFGGGAVGFLFGIPRTMRPSQVINGSNNHQGMAEGVDASGNGQGQATIYGSNTNIEEISDWLTKILVGVSLVQLGQIRANMSALNIFLSQGFTPEGEHKVFTFGLTTYSALLGFFYGYLWTRLILKEALTSSEFRGLRSKVNTVDQRQSLDQKALLSVNHQLMLSPYDPPTPQAELNQALAGASPDQLRYLFNVAVKQRWENRGVAAVESGGDDQVQQTLQRQEQNRQRLNLIAVTVPVFRALIAADTKGQYHRNHSQLAYALKDLVAQGAVSSPSERLHQLKEARSELDRAIEIRDASHEKGFQLYEANRAHCLILMDPDFQNGRPSSPELRAEIQADLAVASRPDASESAQKMVATFSDIVQWQQLNNQTPE